MPRTRFSIGSLMSFVLVVALGIGGLKAANPLWASGCYSLAFVALIAAVLLAIQTRARKRAYWVGFSVAGWTYFIMTFMWSPASSSSSFEAPPLLTTILFEMGETYFFPQNNVTITGTLSGTITTTPPTLVVPVPPPLAVSPAPLAPQQITTTDPGSSATTPATLPVLAATPTSPTGPVAVPSPVFQPANATPSYVVNANGTITTASLTFPIPAGTPIPMPGMIGVGDPEMSFLQIGQSMATLFFAYIGGLFSLFLAGRRERNEANPSPLVVSPSSP